MARTTLYTQHTEKTVPKTKRPARKPPQKRKPAWKPTDKTTRLPASRFQDDDFVPMFHMPEVPLLVARDEDYIAIRNPNDPLKQTLCWPITQWPLVHAAIVHGKLDVPCCHK